MARESADSSATPNVEDTAPELASRLRHLDHERLRCLEYAAKLSGWAMFWKILLIMLGALVAAQGAFADVWGRAGWITIAFIVFGVLIALASGFDAIFKPAERSPRFAHMGFEYERLHRELLFATSSLLRQFPGGSTEYRDGAFHGKVEKLARQSDAKLDAVREKELNLYVTGPARLGYSGVGREKLWRRWSG